MIYFVEWSFLLFSHLLNSLIDFIQIFLFERLRFLARDSYFRSSLSRIWHNKYLSLSIMLSSVCISQLIWIPIFFGSIIQSTSEPLVKFFLWKHVLHQVNILNLLIDSQNFINFCVVMSIELFEDIRHVFLLFSVILRLIKDLLFFAKMLKGFSKSIFN